MTKTMLTILGFGKCTCDGYSNCSSYYSNHKCICEKLKLKQKSGPSMSNAILLLDVPEAQNKKHKVTNEYKIHCKASTHQCTCQYNSVLCKASEHKCICEIYYSSCISRVHLCTCFTNHNNCRSDEHICVCNHYIQKSESCLLNADHTECHLNAYPHLVHPLPYKSLCKAHRHECTCFVAKAVEYKRTLKNREKIIDVCTANTHGCICYFDHIKCASLVHQCTCYFTILNTLRYNPETCKVIDNHSCSCLVNSLNCKAVGKHECNCHKFNHMCIRCGKHHIVILNSLWKMDMKEYTNYFQWMPREIMEDTAEMLL